MDNSTINTIISTSGVVVTALVMAVINTVHLNKRLERIEHTLDLIEADLKMFDHRIFRIEEKLGLSE
jgi:hypothetical protein